MKPTVARRVRWTVDEYFRMADAGLFAGRRVELIEGEVIEVAAQGHLHRLAVTRTSRQFFSSFGPDHWVVVQGTLRLPPRGAPDPDLHVFDVPEGTPDPLLPLPILVIEISDSTYPRDSGHKLRAYARAGVPDYWIYNLPHQRIEVYRHPENPTARPRDWRYASVAFHGSGERVALLKEPQVSFAVDALLP